MSTRQASTRPRLVVAAACWVPARPKQLSGVDGTARTAESELRLIAEDEAETKTKGTTYSLASGRAVVPGASLSSG